MQERRKFSRWQTKEKVHLDREEGREETSLLDISPGGMRVLLDSKVKIGSSILGKFKIIAGQEPFYVRGEVIWVKSVVDKANRRCYEVGVRFDKVSTTPI